MEIFEASQTLTLPHAELRLPRVQLPEERVPI